MGRAFFFLYSPIVSDQPLIIVTLDMETPPDPQQIRMNALAERGCPVCGMQGEENFKQREDPLYLPLQPRLQAGSVAPVAAVSCINCRHVMLFGKFG
jgi:hypothetical protein